MKWKKPLTAAVIVAGALLVLLDAAQVAHERRSEEAHAVRPVAVAAMPN